MFNVKTLCSIGANVEVGVGPIAGEGQRRTISQLVASISHLDSSHLGKI